MMHPKDSVVNTTFISSIYSENRGIKFLPNLSTRSPVPGCQNAGETACLILHELHWRERYQILGTLQRELSDSWYTEAGGMRLLLHCRWRYQTLGTLQMEVSDPWYTADEGIRLLVHWRVRYQTLLKDHCPLQNNTVYIYSPPLQYQIRSDTIKLRSTQRYSNYNIQRMKTKYAEVFLVILLPFTLHSDK